MKKFFFGLILTGLAFSGIALAQALPESATLEFHIINASQENADAMDVGAQAGDVLRYELMLSSETEDVMGFETSVDLTQILKAGEVIDTGLGEIDGNILTFPSVDKSAPCTHEFTFFVRIGQNCGGMQTLPVRWEGINRNITLHCGLAPTGPDAWGTFIFGILAAAAIFLSWGFSRKEAV